MKLEDSSQAVKKYLLLLGNQITLLSEKKLILQNGIQAYECNYSYKSAGLLSRNYFVLSVFKEEKWIRLDISAFQSFSKEKLKQILYSLEFEN